MTPHRAVVPVHEGLRCRGRDLPTWEASLAALLRTHGLDPDRPYRWWYDSLAAAWIYEQDPPPAQVL